MEKANRYSDWSFGSGASVLYSMAGIRQRVNCHLRQGVTPRITVAKSPLQCAGLNRYEAGEEESLRERGSDPLGPEFCVVAPRGSQRSVNRGIGGLGIELRKDAIRTPTQL